MLGGIASKDGFPHRLPLDFGRACEETWIEDQGLERDAHSLTSQYVVKDIVREYEVKVDIALVLAHENVADFPTRFPGVG